MERNPAPLRADRAGDLVEIVADVFLAGLDIPLAYRRGDEDAGMQTKPSLARKWIGQPSTARKVTLAFFGLTAGAFGSVAALGGGGDLSSRLRGSGLNGMTTPIRNTRFGRLGFYLIPPRCHVTPSSFAFRATSSGVPDRQRNEAVSSSVAPCATLRRRSSSASRVHGAPS
jgi:hypothetical protein